MHPTRTMHSQQRGLSMIGFLFVAMVLVFIAMLAMKLVPAYIEYFSVKKILSTMGQESDLKSQSNADIRTSFSKRANVGYVTAVKPEDLTVDRSSGTPVISADYEFRTKLVGNVSLVVDFSASSDPNAAPVEVE
jgi:exopolysaccharide biosynthesis protein